MSPFRVSSNATCLSSWNTITWYVILFTCEVFHSTVMGIDWPIPRCRSKCIIFRNWLFFIILLSALSCAVRCPVVQWTIILSMFSKLWNYFGCPCCRKLVRFPYTFLFRRFYYLVKTTIFMLEIQARCEPLLLAVQLVHTSKPEVYVKHKNSTTTPHKPLLTEIIPVYSESQVELLNTLWEQNAEFLILYRVVHIVTTVV
jgi:hypothetical protein